MARLSSSELLFLCSLSLLSLDADAFHLKDEQRTAPHPNFMKEYMTRGMLQCTANYVETIVELQKLIKKAYMEHLRCQEEMDKADKNYPKIDFALLDELQDSWRAEDEKLDSSDGVTPAPTTPPTTTESSLSRRKRTHKSH